ncbi:MAG: SNF2-related protein [Rhodopila sp.]
MRIVPIASDIDPSLALSDADIRSACNPAAFAAGRTYEQRGRVQNLLIAERGALITATTQGSRADPYLQRLTISKAHVGLRIQGLCSCPIGRQCKHLAAVLVAAQRKEHTMPRARPEVPRSTVTPPQREALSPQIESWLREFDRDDEELTEEFPASIRSRIFYVLSLTGVDKPRLQVEPMTVSLRKDGSAGSVRRYTYHAGSPPAKYLRPSDRLVLPRLARRSAYAALPADDDPADTLRRILSTGRARWQTAEGSALSEGPERDGQITWTTNPDASQQPVLSLGEALIGVRIPDPWYIDPKSGLMGPIRFDLPAPVVRRLLSAPAIPPEAAAEVRAQLARRAKTVIIPVPHELKPAERVEAPMQPELRLINGTLPRDPNYGRGAGRLLAGGLYETPLARLSYRYGPVVLPRTRKTLPRLTAQGDSIYEVRRDFSAETNAVETLAELGLFPVQDLVPVYFAHAHTEDFALREHGSHHSWLQIVTQDVPRLRAAGWDVLTDEAFPLQVISTDGGIEAELTEGSGIDWLELHLGVMVGEERVDLVPPLLRLLAKPDTAALLEGPDDKPFVVPLQDGRLLSLPMAQIRPTLQALLEFWTSRGGDPDADSIGFSRLDAGELANMEARSGLVWRGGEALRELGQTLRQSGGIPPVSVPDDFRATLRPYQTDGVAWLQFLGSAGLGGVLADDMGLGKTVQTLAHLIIEKAVGRMDRPCLIVCPTSLIPNWLAEAHRFAPNLSVLSLHGAARKGRFKDIPRHDIVLSTYPLLTRDHEVLTQQNWHIVILDEAQSIKNPDAETTRQALRLKARQRLCLSGTPLQNHLGELWSLFDFLAPGFLGSQRSFKSVYRTPIEKQGDPDRQALLNRRVRPFMLRRTKQEVVAELPPKTEITEPVELEAAQRAIYEAIRLSMHARVQAAIAQKGLARSGIIILDALLKMRQACCDPRLLKLQTVAKSKARSAKLDRLMEMLAIMLDEGRRILLFSQFTEMLALIEDRLQEDDIAYEILTGDTRDRAAPVKRFQCGNAPLFLISLKAGGVGLNLTAADTVIHYDPWWNPAVEDQATDRAHRIGQTNKVFVHRLVTLGTIEEKMEQLKDKKRSLVASVMEADHGGAMKLTGEDIEDLFAPAQ